MKKRRFRNLPIALQIKGGNLEMDHGASPEKLLDIFCYKLGTPFRISLSYEHKKLVQ